MSPETEQLPLPRTIDQVIERLDQVVEDAVGTGSRAGYFAALYNRVTMAVRDGIRAGAFQDNARMERLDVAFANRYIDAFDRFQRGAATTLSWQLAFDAGSRRDLSVLQHLLLGMNAHINLDLGIACATVAPGAAIGSLEPDFNHINDVLASLLPAVETQLTEISRLLGVAVDIARNLDDLDQRVGSFSMREARASAWRFARVLAHLDSPLARDLALKARDGETAIIGSSIQKPGPLSVLLGGADWSGVATHVRMLARRETGIAGV